MAKKDAAPKRKKLSVEPYKGVRDFYPEGQAFLNYFMETCRSFVEKVGYVEYHASVLEPAELYRAKGAENEEIMGEQAYVFIDRGEREVALRPEMTPTVARMVAAKRRELGFPLRWYSIPNVFRYERPQRGRLREHWQLNVDLFGSKSPYADAEILGVAYGLMGAFGAKESDFVIKVGSRIWTEEITREWDNSKRQAFYSCLDAKGKLDADTFKAKLEEIGVLEDTLANTPPPQEIARMISEFNAVGINNIEWDYSIVRGFNYYTGMVFEVFDTNPRNNRSLFGGGRYDNLTGLFDNEPIAGVGFGMGDATLHDFLESRGLLPAYVPPTKVYLAITKPELALAAQTLAGELRREGVAVAIDFGERKLGDQLKVAGKHKIPYVIVVGEEELNSDNFVARNLETGGEAVLKRQALGEFFNSL